MAYDDGSDHGGDAEPFPTALKIPDPALDALADAPYARANLPVDEGLFAGLHVPEVPPVTRGDGAAPSSAASSPATTGSARTCWSGARRWSFRTCSTTRASRGTRSSTGSASAPTSAPRSSTARERCWAPCPPPT